MGRYRQRPRELQKYGHLWSRVLVDPCDLWLLTAYAWGIHMRRDTPYVVGSDRINGRVIHRSFHRMIMNASSGMQVDHINGDTLDNRRCNLRLCTCAENAQNRKLQGGSSNFKGVHWYRRDKKWYAQIRVNKGLIHLGYFDDEEGAAFAYDVAARILFGEFARLNFQENDR